MTAWDEHKKNRPTPVKVWRFFTERATPEVVEKRYEICKGCEEFNPLLRQCGICKCFMPYKTTLDGAVCPIGKW